MSLWTANSTVFTKPKFESLEWLVNTYINSEGIKWHNTASQGDDETLVTSLGSPAILAGPTSTKAFFSGNVAAYVQGYTNAQVTISFNQPITVTGAPTLVVSGNNVNATATYVASSVTGSFANAPNKAHFKFTIPANTQTLSIVGQTITTGASNNIVATSNASINAVVTFANSAVTYPRANGSAAALTANVTTISIA